MATLKRIRDICDQYRGCEDGCPFYNDRMMYNKADCLMDAPPCSWDLGKIEEVLKEVKDS